MPERISLKVLITRELLYLAKDYVAAADIPGKVVSFFLRERVLDKNEPEPDLYVFTGLNRLGPATANLLTIR